MKKILVLSLALLMIMAGLTGCKDTEKSKGEYKVVCTTFPQYDWVKEIIGDDNDNIDVDILLDNGVDLHSYQPTTEDVANIASCDMFIYVGGESDEWVDQVLEENKNDHRIVINLMEVLGDEVKEEELVEGMEHAHDAHGEENHDAHEEENHDAHEEENHDAHEEENHDAHEEENHDAHEEENHDAHEEENHDAHEEENHDAHEEENHDAHEEEKHDAHEEGENDEHIWLSLKNAQKLIPYIAEKLDEMDSENKEIYDSNGIAYEEKIAALDSDYQQVIKQATKKQLIFGDRFPFRYLVDDYGLTYYAAFSGCSAESEASFETIVFLAEKVDEGNVPVVLTIEGSDNSIAETIINNTEAKNQKILSLNSMQSITAKDIEDGASYLGIMEENLMTLKEAVQ